MAEETVPVPVEDEKMEETAAPSTSAEQVEGAEDLDNEAKKLMGAGSRHMVMKDIRSAVNAFQEASSVLMENGVLGNALEGMPEDEEEDGEKEEDPNIPSAANLDEKEREQLREQVYDAMAEQEKPEKSEEPKTEGKEGNGDVDMEECDKPSEDKGTEERTNGETPASSSEKVDETKKGAAAVTETEKASVAEEKGAAAVTEVKGSAVTETEKGAVTEEKGAAAVTETEKGAVTEEKGAAAVTETEKGAEEKGAVVTESEKGAAVTEEKDAAMDETEKGAVTEEKDAAVVAETGKGAAVTEKGAAGKAEESMDESKGEEKDTDASKSEETQATEKAEEKTEDSSKPPAKETDSSKTSAVSEPPSQASEEAKPAAKETEGAKPPAEETASKEPDVKDAKVEGEEEAEPMEGEEGEDGESEESEENEGTDEKENDEEEVGNLQLAWEMLDLSKVIFKRQQTKEAQLKAAQAHLKLGEVSIESENYGQAIEDFLSCLNIQKEHLEKHDRLLAETHYQLGLAYQYSSKHDSAISHFTQSTEVIEKRVAVLTEQLEKAAGESTEELQKEMDELKGLLPDIREKIEDSKEAQKTSEVTEKALKETLAGGSSGFSQENGSTSSSAPPAPAEKSADSTVPVTNCVSDISHLVRKKRKPEEESPLKEAKKAKAEPLENGSGNGDAVVPTKEEVEKTEEAEKQTPMETPMETTAVESSA